MLRHELLDAARHLTGAKVLAARLYGAGPVTALAMTCSLGGADRFSSSRKAVRFAGLDITVYSSDGKRPPGHLSRQGPPVLRWAVYEAGKTCARASAPGHDYYAAVKDRKNGRRATLSQARKIVRQACHILTELGGDALTAGDHLTVAAPSGYPTGSYDVLQHDHQHLSSTTHPGARTGLGPSFIITRYGDPCRRRNVASETVSCLV